jgi:hypothetical protein
LICNASVTGCIRVSFLAAIMSVLAQSVAGQEQTGSQPRRGLFGPDSSSSKQTFDINWSVLTGHQNDGLIDTEIGSDPQVQLAGNWGAADASAKYAIHGRHASLIVNTFGRGRYYPDLQRLKAFDGTGDLSFGADLGTRTKIVISQAARYQPYYQLNVVSNVVPLGPPDGTAADDALTRNASHTYEGGVELSEKLGIASSLALRYGYRHTRSQNLSDSFRWQLASGAFAHKLTRRTALKLGYGFEQAHDGLRITLPAVAAHKIDFGLNYAKPLSASRRMAVAFDAGTTVITDYGSRYRRLLINGTFDRDIGRRWTASAGYHRGVSFIEGFAGPMYADSVDVRVAGLIAGRVRFGGSSGYAQGQVGFSRNSPYMTLSEIADVRIALNRVLSFITRYDYSHYDFDPTVAIPFGLARSMHRQSIRVGLAGWMPLLARSTTARR